MLFLTSLWFFTSFIFRFFSFASTSMALSSYSSRRKRLLGKKVPKARPTVGKALFGFGDCCNHFYTSNRCRVFKRETEAELVMSRIIHSTSKPIMPSRVVFEMDGESRLSKPVYRPSRFRPQPSHLMAMACCAPFPFVII